MNKEIAYSYLQKTIELKDKIEVAFLNLGERLYKIRTEELWKNGHDSYFEFLMEAKISESTASKLETVYRHFVLNLKLSHEKVAKVGWTDAYLISQIALTKDTAEEWLDKGEILSSGDLRKEIMEFRTKKDMKDCRHSNKYQLEICRDCGFKARIYDEE